MQIVLNESFVKVLVVDESVVRFFFFFLNKSSLKTVEDGCKCIRFSGFIRD